MNGMIEQFTYGKLIAGNRDLRGYTLVARSPNLPSDEWISRLRAQADIGQIYDLSIFPGADVAFTLGDYVVMGRLQKSPRQYARGHFLQEHYLVTTRETFAALGNNFIYLQAALPAEIKWRTQDETLPQLSIPIRQVEDEAARAEHLLKNYADLVFATLAVYLDQQPCAVIPPEGFAQAMEFCETLGLLLPLPQRAELSWATNVMNARQCQARVKLVAPQGGGLDGHTLIRVNTAATVLTQTSRFAQSYVSTLRLYCDRFGIAALLRALEAGPLITVNEKSFAENLDLGLWRYLGPTILEFDLRHGTIPHAQTLFTEMLPMLDQDTFSVSPEQRSLFLYVIVDGILKGTLSVSEAHRIPRDVTRAHPDTLWAGLAQSLAPTGDPRESKRWEVLATWRLNKTFWELPATQRLLYTLLCYEIDTLANTPERALARIRHYGVNDWIPISIDYRADLINRAIAHGNYTAESLIAAWVDTITHPGTALATAQAIPPLQAILYNHSSKFVYILHALNRADSKTINGMLATQDADELAQSADLFLSLALMGERVGLTGFRAPCLIETLRASLGRIQIGRVKRLLAIWESQLTTFDPEIAQAIAFLMMSVGNVDGLKNLLAVDWRWIDTLLAWMCATPINAPTYASVFALVLDWLRAPLPSAPAERHKRLAQFFGFWAQQTQGTDARIGELTSLMLRDAMRGLTTVRQHQGVLAQVAQFFQFGEHELARCAASGVRLVHDTLFPRGTPAALWYRDAFLQACANAWEDRKLLGDLIDALERQNLLEEADWVETWNLQIRGAEIIASLSAMLQAHSAQQAGLMRNLREIKKTTSQDLTAWIPEAARREELTKQLARVMQDAGQLNREIRQLQTKLRS